MSSLILTSPVPDPVALRVQEMPNPAGKADLGEAARQFEGMLMAQIFQAMRKTVDHGSLFGESSLARSTYEYLLDQAVVDHAMKSGKGWGMAARLEAQWKASQEL